MTLTWYRNGIRIGHEMDLANYMLDAVSGANDDPDGDKWASMFEEYVNTNFEPMEVMRYCEHDRCGYSEFFVDWVVDQAQYSLDFAEDFGFEEIEEEENEDGQEE